MGVVWGEAGVLWVVVYIPLADLREHSVECSMWMSSGLSNAETLARSSVIAADTEERRIVFVCVRLLY